MTRAAARIRAWLDAPRIPDGPFDDPERTDVDLAAFRNGLALLIARHMPDTEVGIVDDEPDAIGITLPDGEIAFVKIIPA